MQPRSSARVKGLVITSRTSVLRLLARALVSVAAHQDNGQVGRIADCGKGKGDAIHHRHLDVGQQQVKTARGGLECAQRLPAIAGVDHIVAIFCKGALQLRSCSVIVFGQEDARHVVLLRCDHVEKKRDSSLVGRCGNIAMGRINVH